MEEFSHWIRTRGSLLFLRLCRRSGLSVFSVGVLFVLAHLLNVSNNAINRTTWETILLKWRACFRGQVVIQQVIMVSGSATCDLSFLKTNDYLCFRCEYFLCSFRFARTWETILYFLELFLLFYFPSFMWVGLYVWIT